MIVHEVECGPTSLREETIDRHMAQGMTFPEAAEDWDKAYASAMKSVRHLRDLWSARNPSNVVRVTGLI